MQNTSALYRQILADPTHWYETSVVIDDKNGSPDNGYGEDTVFSVNVSSKMMDADLELGKAVSAEIDVQMLNPSGGIPRMAAIVPYTRICNATQKSEWLRQGVFYVDTRETTHNSNGLDILTLHGYDAMLMTEQYYDDLGLDWSSGTVTDIAMVQAIANKIGVTVDSRTWAIMTDAFAIPAPLGYTLREVLGYIAGAYAGCFLMTDLGELRLVSVAELPEQTNLLIDQAGNYITVGGFRILLVNTEGD